MKSEYSTTIQSPVGVLKISSTTDEIISVSFADTSTIERRKPEILEKCIAQLKEYFAGDRTMFELPLRSDGSSFQKAVWGKLNDIPYGTTVSYGEIASRLDNPKSIRAVGTANGKNPLPILVPCHRVIGGNGSLTGYSGELWRKKWLLEHEARFAHGVQKLF